MVDRTRYLASCILGLALVATGLAMLSGQRATNWLRAERMEQLATHLPPSSIMRHRLQAMAVAMRNGSKVYTFEVNQQLPPLREDKL